MNWRQISCILFFVPLFFSSTSVLAEELSFRMRSVLEAHTRSIKVWARSPLVVSSTIEHNARNISLDDLKTIDKQWIAGKKEAFALSLQNSRLGKYFKQKVVDNEIYTEAFLCDRHGAVVGLYPKTSDYWQGDEEKFIASFNAGEGKVYTGPVEHDESTDEMSVQISVPVIDNGETIGVLVVGVKNI